MRAEGGELTPELMLDAFRAGRFPMAASRGAQRISWVDPDTRGVLPLDAFHLPRRLARTVARGAFEVTADRDFAGVIRACAEMRGARREETWINRMIEEVFVSLSRQGHAHSIEVWRDGALAGGLYGCAVGAAFFGESMFSRCSDASKVALVHLVARLRMGGFRLLDTQDVTGHLVRFGVTGIDRAEYKRRLALAVADRADWIADPAPGRLAEEFRRLVADGGAGASDGRDHASN